MNNIFIKINECKYLLIKIIIISLLIYYIRDIILPFTVSALITYISYPVSKYLSNKIKSKIIISIIINISLVIFITLFFFMFLPNLYSEIEILISKVSKYRYLLKENSINIFKQKLFYIDHSLPEKFQDILSSFSDSIFKYIMNVISNMWSSSVAFINLLSLFFLIPIINFYFIRDQDQIIAEIKNYSNIILGNKINLFISKQLFDIDKILQNYMKGQLIVCLILSFYYSICLEILNLDCALTIGILSGILIIIPYIGFILGLFLASSICLIQSNGESMILIVVSIYIIGQVIESNIITPKIIGEKIGVHPVWIIFSIILFNKIFGITGAIIAIPLAAIVKYEISEYLIFIDKNNYKNIQLDQNLNSQ